MTRDQMADQRLDAGLNACCLLGVVTLWVAYVAGCLGISVASLALALKWPAAGVPVLAALIVPLTVGGRLVVRPLTVAFHQIPKPQ